MNPLAGFVLMYLFDSLRKLEKRFYEKTVGKEELSCYICSPEKREFKQFVCQLLHN